MNNAQIKKAKDWYKNVFNCEMTKEVIEAARKIKTRDELYEYQPGVDQETGEYLNSPFSAGEFDAFDWAFTVERG